MPVLPPAIQERAGRLVALVLLFTALAAGVLWWQAERSHDQLGSQLMQQAEQRSQLLADAMAGQISGQLRMADLALLSLRREWVREPLMFDAVARQMLGALPTELVTRITVADADGQVLYSSLGDEGSRYLGDQPAFRAHQAGDDQLVIGMPERSPANPPSRARR